MLTIPDAELCLLRIVDWLIGPIVGIGKDIGPELSFPTILALITDESAEDAARID